MASQKRLIPVAFVLFTLTVAVDCSAKESPQYAPGQIIVRYKDARGMGISKGQRRAPARELSGMSPSVKRLHERYGLREVRRIFGDRSAAPRADLEKRLARRARRAPPGGEKKAAAIEEAMGRTVLLQFDASADLKTLAEAYRADPNVEFVQANQIYSVEKTLNDPYLASSNTWGQNTQDLWGLYKVNAPAAWDYSNGNGVLVAVVDSGVDVVHPDLAANIWTIPGEVPGNGIDDDGNGYVDDFNGWNFASGNADITDRVGHGTHVAGTIAAVGNNQIGVAGLANGSRILVVKGIGDQGAGYTTDLVNALRYAADNGADVINNSWGGTGSDPVLHEAIIYAHSKGAVVVASAGNSHYSAFAFQPASFAEAITVAAFDPSDLPAYFSNFGKIDVAAPGVSVLSTLSSGSRYPMVATGYGPLAGTSMAAPHVSALAALILSGHPTYVNEQVRQVIRASADDVGAPGVDQIAGFGRINALRAVQFQTLQPSGPMAPLPLPFVDPYRSPPKVTISEPAAGSTINTVVTIKGTFSPFDPELWPHFLPPIIFLIDGQLASGFSSVRLSPDANGGGSYQFDVNLAGLSNGPHQFTVRAYNILLVQNEVSKTYNVNNPISNATYDPILQTAKCGSVGAACDSGVLFLGGDELGGEPHWPNTIHSFCSSHGSIFRDETSLDKMRIASMDGTLLSPGKAVQVQATVWVTPPPFPGASQRVEFFYASDAAQPEWKLFKTIQPSSLGAVVISATYTIPVGGYFQAVRGRIREISTSDDCAQHYDNDDLVFKSAADYDTGAISVIAPQLQDAVFQRASIPISAAVSNDGSAVWKVGTGEVRLLSQDPLGNVIWGSSAPAITNNPIPATIATGQTASFASLLTAPSTPGVYGVRWRMTRNGTPFGDDVLNRTVTVVEDAEPPTAPANVQLIAPFVNNLTLTWKPSTDNVGVTEYRLDVSTTADFQVLLATYTNRRIDVGASQVVLSSLTLNTQYFARLRAVDVNGLSSVFAGAQGMTLASPDVTPPSSPGGVTLLVDNTRIKVRWKPSTDDVGIRQYRVEWTGSRPPWFVTLSTTVSIETLEYMITGLAPSVQHFVRVRALDYAGNGSSALSVDAYTLGQPDTTAPTAPSGIRALSISSTSLRLSWTGSSDSGAGLAEYRFIASTKTPIQKEEWAGIRMPVPAGTSGFSESFKVADLLPSTPYWFSMWAVDRSINQNEGAATMIGPITTRPPALTAAPAALSAVKAKRFSDRIFTYPNPARGNEVTFHLGIGVGRVNRLSLRIYDVTGRTVAQANVEETALKEVNGEWAFVHTLSTRDLSSGVYIYTVEAQAEDKTIRANSKFIVIK